jgi:hypothetical protein
VAAYTVAAVVFTWPLVFNMRTLFGATDPGGDPALNLWILGWDLSVLTAHPSWLLTGRVFEANIFFPAHQTLAYSDHLLPQAIVLWPIYAVTRDLVLCYNLLLVGSLIASATAMHVLARALTGSERASYVAGLIFGFAPYHFTHLTHIQLQSLYFLPLSFLLLHRLFDRRERRDVFALGLVLGLQILSSAYYGVIGAIGIAVAGMGLLVAERRWRDWRLMRRGLLAGAIAVLIALPWSVPYLRVQREAEAGRNLFEAAQASAVPASYLQAPDTNLIYGRTGWLRPGPEQRLTRKDGPEQALFPGFCALLLAMFGAVRSPRPLRVAATVYCVVAIVGFLLSLGPNGIRPLYSALYEVVFGMQAIRAAARFSVLTLAGIAILAAIAVRAWEIRAPRMAAGSTTAALLLIAAEFSNGAIAFPARPVLTSEAGAWLASQPGTGAVICIPTGFDTVNTPCMLQSLEHRRPIVNGYSGIRPPFFPAVVDAMSQIPSPRSLLTLHDLGVEYIVADGPLTVADPFAATISARGQFGRQHIYQLTWTPETVAAITAADEGPAPPDAGLAGFAAGESATYRVRWTNGPMNVSAGEMTLAVGTPREGEAYRFLASAKTAPWVARFFEADAQLETTADARLFPISHVETIVEGKRRVERRIDFDFTARQLRMITGGDPVTLPLAANARDPMTALFYVRTLPLAPGASFSLPLSDNGRASRLDITVGPLETVTLDGQPWKVWRVEPRIRQRIERQRPLEITAWMTADARRLPVIMDISAGFGAVRAELMTHISK